MLHQLRMVFTAPCPWLYTYLSHLVDLFHLWNKSELFFCESLSVKILPWSGAINPGSSFMSNRLLQAPVPHRPTFTAFFFFFFFAPDLPHHRMWRSDTGAKHYYFNLTQLQTGVSAATWPEKVASLKKKRNKRGWGRGLGSFWGRGVLTGGCFMTCFNKVLLIFPLGKAELVGGHFNAAVNSKPTSAKEKVCFS